MVLTKPIVTFDLETTGTSVSDARIVEICLLRVGVDGTKTIDTLRVNPTVPIPAEASAVHGITDADVADKPTFKDIAEYVLKVMEGCDLCGFNNLRYDVPVLAEEFARIGVTWDLSNTSIVDAFAIFTKKEPRDLASALRFYCGEELVGAHAAENDVLATWNVFVSQVDRYGLGSVQEISAEFAWDKNALDLDGKIVRNDKGDIVFSFGKNKGQRLLDNLSYCNWMLGGEFSSSTKSVVRDVISGKLK